MMNKVLTCNNKLHFVFCFNKNDVKLWYHCKKILSLCIDNEFHFQSVSIASSRTTINPFFDYFPDGECKRERE